MPTWIFPIKSAEKHFTNQTFEHPLKSKLYFSKQIAETTLISLLIENKHKLTVLFNKPWNKIHSFFRNNNSIFRRPILPFQVTSKTNWNPNFARSSIYWISKKKNRVKRSYRVLVFDQKSLVSTDNQDWGSIELPFYMNLRWLLFFTGCKISPDNRYKRV